MLIGAVNSQTLFAFAQNVRHVLTAVVVGTLVLGILSSLLIARKLAHPVELLYHEVVDGQEKKEVPGAVPYKDPGAGPSGRCTDQPEQRAAEQLHKVFAHHGYGQCGAGRL